MVGGDLRRSVRRADTRFALALLSLIGGCTEPVARTPIKASIDADSVVRTATVRIEVFVEGQLGGGSSAWEMIESPVFKPEPQRTDEWPFAFKLKSEESDYERFSMTAVARDRQGSVVARAQTIRERSQARRTGLHVHFDTACFRRTDLCDDGKTCFGGACVDAASVDVQPPAESGQPTATATNAATGSPDAPQGVASAGATCREGERACAEHASLVPLRCENGRWVEQAKCSDKERCDTSEGSQRGSCQPIAEECRNRQASVPYCDGEAMRVCEDLVSSKVRPCSNHERCVADGASATCGCVPGYVREGDQGPCAPARSCSVNNGGCDPATTCSMQGDKPACSACPSGFAGSGEMGCAPLLESLRASRGVLEPPFSPTTNAYRLRVPLVVTTVDLLPRMAAGVNVTLNGAALPETGQWRSRVLPLGETKVDVVATTKFGASSKYAVTVERTGMETDFLKADEPDAYDQFGVSLALSGDTFVAGSWFEDGNSKGVNGDEKNNALTDSGAAWVYVREGGSWKKQAYLKASDPQQYDYFGAQVALDGDTLVVGAIHEGLFELSQTQSRPGAAYVFVRKNGGWAEAQRLAASSPAGADMYGLALALEGDTLLVGASYESTGGAQSGAVYVYERTGGMFVERQKLKSAMPRAGAFFGSRLALEGDQLVVGASNDSTDADTNGSAEVFLRKGGMWTSVQRLSTPMPIAGANFGYALGIQGDRIAVGAPRTASLISTVMTPPGEVYLFDRDRGTDHWSQSAVLSAIAPDESDFFGLTLQFTETALVVGAPGDASGARGVGADPKRTDAQYGGALYLFGQGPDGWIPSAFIKGHNTDANDAFSWPLAVDGETILVGATLEGSSDRGVGTTDAGLNNASAASGAVYVFR